eukprot:1507229-Pleurochrysis_carterae.AAC.1
MAARDAAAQGPLSRRPLTANATLGRCSKRRGEAIRPSDADSARAARVASLTIQWPSRRQLEHNSSTQAAQTSKSAGWSS